MGTCITKKKDSHVIGVLYTYLLASHNENHRSYMTTINNATMYPQEFLYNNNLLMNTVTIATVRIQQHMYTTSETQNIVNECI